MIKTPYGQKKLVYADCTGTGAYDPEVDEWLSEKVLPYYCNVHSDSKCAELMTIAMSKARQVIKKSCCHPNEKFYNMIFTGNGATCAARHLGHVLKNKGFEILIESVLEHHSNALMWEKMFEKTLKKRYILKIDATTGKIDTDHLASLMRKHSNDKVFVALTACSNVTGVIQPIDRIHKFNNTNAFVCVDYAACSPYIDVNIACYPEIDAMIFSPHKFKGGYSTPGVLVFKKKYYDDTCVPFFPGGGTVCYHDSTRTVFIKHPEYREEGGTPNIIGIIKTGYLFRRKNDNLSRIRQRIKEVVEYVDERIYKDPSRIRWITPVFESQNDRLPIYSFSLMNAHPNLIVKLLSDIHGVQTRGGVSCCSLLAEEVVNPCEHMKSQISNYKGVPKEYGWVRVSFYYDSDDHEIDFILEAIEDVIQNYEKYGKKYTYVSKYNSWLYSEKMTLS